MFARLGHDAKDAHRIFENQLEALAHHIMPAEEVTKLQKKIVGSLQPANVEPAEDVRVAEREIRYAIARLNTMLEKLPAIPKRGRLRGRTDRLWHVFHVYMAWKKAPRPEEDWVMVKRARKPWVLLPLDE